MSNINSQKTITTASQIHIKSKMAIICLGMYSMLSLSFARTYTSYIHIDIILTNQIIHLTFHVLFRITF